ncbi:MAG: DinB family protein [Acidobacteriaceae bacterium]
MRREILRQKSDLHWELERSSSTYRVPARGIMVRRMNHTTHHRGQLFVYLRLLEQRVPLVYGPTADTDGKVTRRFG